MSLILKRSYAPKFLNRRMGFFLLMVFLFWLKTCFSYLFEFNLGIESIQQYLILLINPFPTAFLIFSIALYIKSPKKAYTTLFILSLLTTILLFSNVVYYREFSDFITVNTVLSTGKVSAGLGESALKLFRPYDVFYFLDYILLIFLFVRKKIKLDASPVVIRKAFAITSMSLLLFSINLSLAEADRPELLKRTFSRDHIVKYLGINAFSVYDGVQTYKSNQNRAQAKESDLVSVQKYVNSHYAAPDQTKFGIAKGKNVIYIHLESFQQFLINYKLKDANGVEHEVTPFLNSIFKDKSTFSFTNVYHQVSSGKTSDAETLLENSLFGLSQGPLFTQLGDKNTFQAAPAILSQKAGYTSAVFHGNAGTFWNRNETYKRFGFNYFFDSSYYNVTSDNTSQYGLHDKELFKQSIQYLEHLQQPFYTKFISVTNHYPYPEFKGAEAGFPLAQTSDSTINGYFATANYLDKSIEEFFNYLKESGLYQNSMIVFYGDHYGISKTRNPDLAELLGKTKDTWTDLDDANMQKVPLMFHIPGRTDGSVSNVYGGQVDVLPTLLHLLGVDTKNYFQLGQDLFSKDNEQLVAFRNGDFITPKYTVLGDSIFDNATSTLMTTPSNEVKAEVKVLRKKVEKQLSTSDALNTGDLLRYADNGFKAVNPANYNYKNQLEQLTKIEKQKGAKSTSIYSENHNTSTVDLYKTKTYEQYFGPSTATQNK